MEWNTLIPAVENDVVSVTFEDKEETEKLIYELGDGLQSIICVTYPIFLGLSQKEGLRVVMH